MTIRYQCEGCGATLKIKDEMAGKDGSCPKCQASFVIPEPDIVVEEESPAIEVEGEDDIFGKDFFKAEEASARPEKPAPEKFTPPKSAAPSKEKAAEKKAEPANPTDAAASIARQLLAQGKEKQKALAADPERAAREREQRAKEKLPPKDYSQQIEALKKGLPILAGALVLGLGLWFLSGLIFTTKSKEPPLAPVRGKVKIEGMLVVGAEVRFIPQGATSQDVVYGSFSYGLTTDDGSYKLQYRADKEGAVVGTHRVEVTMRGKTYVKDKVEVKPGDNEGLMIEF